GDRANEALRALPASLRHARIEVLGFGDGALVPLPGSEGKEVPQLPLSTHSDLVTALELLSSRAGERPRAVVVVSDGRLTRPAPTFDAESIVRAAGMPVHTVSLGDEAPKDASIRAIRASGAAVAHQAFPLEVEVGCDPRLECGSIAVTVRELLE